MHDKESTFGVPVASGLTAVKTVNKEYHTVPITNLVCRQIKRGNLCASMHSAMRNDTEGIVQSPYMKLPNAIWSVSLAMDLQSELEQRHLLTEK